MSNRELIQFALFIIYRLGLAVIAVVAALHELWFMAAVILLFAFLSKYNYSSQDSSHGPQ